MTACPMLLESLMLSGTTAPYHVCSFNVCFEDTVPYVVPIIRALSMSTTLEAFDVYLVWHNLSPSILLDVQQAMESMLASSQSLQHFGLDVMCCQESFRDDDNGGKWCQDEYLCKKEMISCLRRNFTVIECDISVTVLHSWGNKQSRHSLYQKELTGEANNDTESGIPGVGEIASFRGL
jgi:hypothetical protein